MGKFHRPRSNDAYCWILVIHAMRRLLRSEWGMPLLPVLQETRTAYRDLRFIKLRERRLRQNGRRSPSASFCPQGGWMKGVRAWCRAQRISLDPVMAVDYQIDEHGLNRIAHEREVFARAIFFARRLVGLARYYAGEQEIEGREPISLSPKAGKLLHELFWQGMVLGLRGDLRAYTAVVRVVSGVLPMAEGGSYAVR